jgi:cytochrome P450
MTAAPGPPPAVPPGPPGDPVLTASGAGEWAARGDAGIRAVLADPRFTVLPPGPAGPPGTVAWLRSSASRFASGPEHRARRALVEAELSRLDPGDLRAAALELARGLLAGCGRPGDRADVMSLLARRVPAAVLAGRLGLADPVRAAAAVAAVAAAWFPGAGARQVPAADTATAWLMSGLGATGAGRDGGPAAGRDRAVARITILVQACDATAGLIGAALHLLQDSPAAGAGCPAGALLARTLRSRPPAPVIRRVAVAAAEVGGARVQAGDLVACDLDAAASDPAAGDPPDGAALSARPGGGPVTGPGLAFGAGLRPCPAPGHALALAAGVIDAVRERCELRPGSPVTYHAGPARLPERLDVVLR